MKTSDFGFNISNIKHLLEEVPSTETHWEIVHDGIIKKDYPGNIYPPLT